MTTTPGPPTTAEVETSSSAPAVLAPSGAESDAGSAAPRGLPSGDDGMATAEYAIVTLAAAGFAGLLAVILRSPEVREAITSIIRSALSG